MAKAKNAEQPSASRDEPAVLTPSIVKLKRIMGPSPACRMLTPYEIELLRQSKAEVDRVTGEVLAEKCDT